MRLRVARKILRDPHSYFHLRASTWRSAVRRWARFFRYTGRALQIQVVYRGRQI